MGLRNFVIELVGLVCRLRTIVKIKSNERVTQILDKERCIKEQIYSRVANSEEIREVYST